MDMQASLAARTGSEASAVVEQAAALEGAEVAEDRCAWAYGRMRRIQRRSRRRRPICGLPEPWCAIVSCARYICVVCSPRP